MTRDTATPQAWEGLVRLWLFAMEHGQVGEVRRALVFYRDAGGGGKITRLRWVPERES